MVRKILFLVLLMFIVVYSSPVRAAVNTGEPAPNFTLSDTYGKPHALVDFKGKFIVLEWLNHDCPFVHKQYDSGTMQALQKEFTAKGVIWLSINSSAEGKEGYYPPDKANELTKQKDAAPTAVLLDSDGTVGKLYGAKTTPHMFIINPDGYLIYQGAIDDKPSADSSDIPSSTNYVKTALDEALAGKVVSVSATKSYGCSVKY